MSSMYCRCGRQKSFASAPSCDTCRDVARENAHPVQLVSGRMRGLWFSRCKCGWEGRPYANRETAKRDGQEHQRCGLLGDEDTTYSYNRAAQFYAGEES